MAPMLTTMLMAQGTVTPDAADKQALQAIFTLHNLARAELGVAPLSWNDRLAAEAQGWADQLASTGNLQHASGGKASGQGENLWAGTRGAYSPDEMMQAWTREKRFFQPGTFPDNSSTGDWRDVAHYTQIVWRRTRAVGCGLGHSDTRDILVCRYLDPGNVDGQMPY